jgi:hypothetical protein
MIAYKFLRSGARTLFTKASWPLPAASGPASWFEASPGPLVPCRNGLHACKVEDLAYWLADELWEIELDAEWIRAPDALIARRARLLRRIDRWEAPDTRSRFAEACVARAAEGFARTALPPGSVAAQYLEQAQGLAGAGNHVATAYVAALVFSALGRSSEAMTAFRAERGEQGQLLATVVGLG